jgi:hypothetical protein
MKYLQMLDASVAAESFEVPWRLVAGRPKPQCPAQQSLVRSGTFLQRVGGLETKNGEVGR